jgi:hypothetical protein
VVGWLNTKPWDQTGDEERAQGWTALIMDINGNGRRDENVEPNAPVDPGKDKRLQPRQYGGGPYALAPAPDGSVWGTMFGFPGAIFGLTPGANPPETALTEVFEVPWNNPAVANAGSPPAAATWSGTACTGPPPWRAGTWPTSTGASAAAR